MAELRRLGYKLGYAQKGKSKVVLGCDNRPGSEGIVACVAKGLGDADVDVVYIGVVPTPVVQWACAYYVADAGIMVTASHNPPEYNGLKYLSCTGQKPALDELEALGKAVEEAPDGEGRVLPPLNASVAKTYCEGRLWPQISLSVAVDCANGAAYNVAKRVLGKTGMQVRFLHHGEGKHINVSCGALHPQSLCKVVQEEGVDFGFALDGDGDRCIGVTKAGRIIDGDACLYLLVRSNLSAYRQTGVVGTVLSNGALAAALKKEGVKLYRSDVGDGNVLACMQKTGCLLGAEPSGHVLTQSGYADGLQTGLLLCKLAEQCDLDALLGEYHPYPQYSTTCPKTKYAYAMAKKAGDKWQDYLAGTGRVVVRESGTEPLVRIMVECQSASLAQSAAEGIRLAAVSPAK